jgi:integrase
MLSWAVEHNLIRANPARDVKKLRYATSGFHTWTLDEVRQYEEHHPIGTKARLALAMLLFIGVRRCDFVSLGRQHVRDGVIKFIPRKTERTKMQAIEIPILSELTHIVAASPCGDLTFLVTEYGKPFTSNGFGNWFRDRCDEAGLPQCTAHGLRKAGATIAADNGATVNQLMAMYGWSSPSQAVVYTQAANRKKLAAEAARLLSDNKQTENMDCPTEVSHREKA